MRRWFVAALAATVLAVGLVAQTGSSSGSSADGSSSSGSSSNGSSSNGSSSNGSSSGDSSNGSSSGGSSSGDSSGGSSSGGSSGGGDDGDGTTEIPGPSVTLPPLPEQFTLPRPDEGDDEVEVPEDPPRELEGKSARERLAALPPVPRRCLDPDLTLLDVFVPGAAIPLRLAYCLLYVGTIARFLGEVDGGSSSARSVEPAPTRTAEGDTVRVPLVQPPRTQRPLATLALLLLIVVVSITIGYVLGQRRAEREAALDRRARGL